VYEDSLRGIEKHLLDGDYIADASSQRAIHLLLEEVKRLRGQCSQLQQRTGLFHWGSAESTRKSLCLHD
jgi:hypothetical protein